MTTLASPVASLALLLAAAPLTPGIVARTKAIAAGRRGQPVWQLYADLLKLVRRGTVYSTKTTVVFRLAPIVLLVTTLVATLLLPLDGQRSSIAFAGDAVAFAYLLALGRFAMVLAALDTGSSFEGMGASREVAFGALTEVGLFIALAALGLVAQTFTLSDMLGDNPARSAGTATAASVMLAASLLALALVECSRVPVDDPATHLELTMIHEVIVLDHSGPDLAMVQYAAAVKLGVFSAIIADVLLPGPRAGGVAGLATLGAALVIVTIIIGAIESGMARLRLPKVPLYIATGSALALFGLILELR